MSALISVIIPVFNAQRYLDKTLDSVLAQTWTDLEVICVNDGSTDDSLAILQAYAARHTRITVITTANAGQSAASNVGIRKASGDFIKFVDADDLMSPEHLERQLNAIRHCPGHLASCKWASFYGDNVDKAAIRPESVWQDLSPEDWLVRSLTQPQGDMMAGWVWLIPRDVLNQAGGWNEALSLNNDFEFSVRLLLASKGVKFAADAVLYHRGDNPGSVSAQMSARAAQSAYLTTRLGCNMLLNMINRDEMRLICANRYQIWLHRLYPAFPDILEKMQREVDRLGGSTRTLKGGWLFQIVQRIFGWRFAKRLRMFKITLLNRLSVGGR